MGHRSVGVGSVNRGTREFGTQSEEMEGMTRPRPTTKREMAIQAYDESIQESMIAEPDILKPTANDLGVMKKPSLPWNLEKHLRELEASKSGLRWSA